MGTFFVTSDYFTEYDGTNDSGPDKTNWRQNLKMGKNCRNLTDKNRDGFIYTGGSILFLIYKDCIRKT